MWQLLLSLYQRGNILGLRVSKWGHPEPELKARHDTRLTWSKISDAANLSWSHRMIHEYSGAHTRTKRKLSSSSFQCIKERLVSTLYEGDISVFVQVVG
jgi:hypothetical protein